MLNTIWIYVWLYTYVSWLEMQGQRTSFAHSHIKMPFVDFVYNVAKSVPVETQTITTSVVRVVW